MIALVASALLGLYVFLPDFLFSRFAVVFMRLKKHQRTKTEEVVAGAVIALIPFLVTLFLSRHCHFIGHWPYPIEESEAVKSLNYRVMLSGLYSETYFNGHQPDFWSAVSHVRIHQFRFLVWNYVFLGVEILFVIFMTRYFGFLQRFALYRTFVGEPLLRRASHWYVLFTGFAFRRSRQPRVMLDVMTRDNHLYDGEVADYFVDSDGTLTGLLLKGFRRFRYSQFEKDRESDDKIRSADYWTNIPGANFFIPYDSIANINVKYEFAADSKIAGEVEDLLEELGVGETDVEFKPEPDSDSFMRLAYVHEKMSTAMEDIITSHKALTLQERVYAAAFGTHTLTEEDFPEDLREQFRVFLERVTAVPSESEGSFKATADALTDEQADNLLKEFYALADDIAQSYASAR